eukprot:gene25737-11397_t
MADLSALIAGGPVFEQLVQQLLLPDNDARKHAEDIFNQFKDQYPDVCTTQLVTVLRTSQNVEHRSFAAIMLRKVLTRDDPALWHKCNAQVQATVKAELLNALKEESVKTVLKKVCDTISELAAEVSDGAGWPEMVPFMFQCVQSNQPGLMESALSIFACLAHYMVDTLKPSLPTLVQVLGACLGHPESEVQLASFRAVSSFIQALEEPSDRDKFQHMIPAMLTCLASTLNAQDEASAQEALEMFIEVAEAHPRFLRKQLVEVVQAMLAVARADQLEDSTRQLAAEFLVTLCEAREKAPGMMRKLPAFTANLFETLMLFLTDVEDDPLWHGADDDQHEDAGAGERYEFGQECLDRISISLGGNAIVAAAALLLPTWLQDADWCKRHAVLICLAQIAEGCTKVMVKELDPLVDMCVKGLADPQAKVRWAACQALGQMCTDLGPEMQNTQHAKILPSLMALMDDFENPRVQAHASAAVVNFSENADPDIMPPYLDTLITKLLLLLQRGKKLVQEGALTAMASVADCSQALFIKYYDSVMPLLTSILVGATDKSHRLLRAKALECISLVGMAVGRDRFRADARKVMEFLQVLQQTEMDSDDPTSSYILQAGARLCKCLKEEFLPYLQIVMPPLLKSARLDPDVKVKEADEDDEDDDEDLERIPIGDKTITIRTSCLEEKATACNMLCCYADELKEGFFPYVKEVTDIMVPLLKFWFHEEVRRAAVQTIPELLRSAVLAVEKGHCTEQGFVKQMLEYVWPPLVEALGKEPDVDVQSTMLDSVSEIVDMVDASMLQEEWVSAVFVKFGNILTSAEERRQERLKRQGTEDFDEEELEALEEENQQEEELFDQVGSCLGAFLKKFNDAVLPFVEKIMPQIAPLLATNRNAEDRRIAVCVVDDLLEHSPAGRVKYFPIVLPILMEAVTSEHADLRQCAVYGLGVLASKSPDMFKSACPEALTRVAAIVSHPDANNDDNEMATDNAVSTLGKIMEFHADVVDVNQVASLWLSKLPLTADRVEAVSQHEVLVKLLEAQDARILGQGNQNMSKIVTTLVRVLGDGTRLIAGDVGKRAAALLHQVQGSTPPETLQGAVFALTPKQQTNFQKYMTGQIPDGADD